MSKQLKAQHQFTAAEMIALAVAQICQAKLGFSQVQEDIVPEIDLASDVVYEWSPFSDGKTNVKVRHMLGIFQVEITKDGVAI